MKTTAERIFGDNEMSHTQKWEYFKFKIRELRNKKYIYIAKEICIMDELNTLMMKESFRVRRNKN